MKFDTLENHQKYVSIVFDEMKIKEGLVYDKHECKVIGFVDVGTINNHLQLYEQTMQDEAQQSKPAIAKHMLVFMVRGLFVNLQFPYAQYPTTDLSADILFPLVWDVVRHLEAVGLKVISLTGDKGPSFSEWQESPPLILFTKCKILMLVMKEIYILYQMYHISSKLCGMLGQTHLAIIKLEHCG